MTVVDQMLRLRGGVTYGSSAALPPLQVADIIALTFRRDAEKQPHIGELAKALKDLQYVRPGAIDEFNNPVSSIVKVC